ncbi:hypothetical protein NAF17_16710 [Mucilaginibacter sp. RB4R14]|uniref:hypothetical protein n=1 Tax=Mucilaginibacter aurantiaciroseus TaxID=2949308 RepID=UPI002090F911|nr:hypothetical protein [Mucilaginibacter aurantiaciroseus]MCO5937189.1 hypothetical protein [Mucilaginibacter aurantiaciroseus]
MEKLKLDLFIERSDISLWGRATYNHSLIVDVASTVTELDLQIAKLLEDFEGIDQREVKFDQFMINKKS